MLKGLVLMAVWLGVVLPNLSHAQILKDKVMIGRVEWVEVPELKIKIRARIDTGAKTTSMHAYKIEELQREDGLWIKFYTRTEEGTEIEMTRKVESTQKVANATGPTTRRYVIREKLKLGSVTREISLNLNDRDKMAYKLLIGRNFLLGHFTVDVARSHVTGD